MRANAVWTEPVGAMNHPARVFGVPSNEATSSALAPAWTKRIETRPLCTVWTSMLVYGALVRTRMGFLDSCSRKRQAY